MLTENETIIDSINDIGILLQIFSGIIVCAIGSMVEEILFRIYIKIGLYQKFLFLTDIWQ